MLDIYIPIAGSTLLLSLLLPQKKISNKKLLSFHVFVYIIFIITLSFGIRELLIPYTQTKITVASAPADAPEAIILKEFDQVEHLPTKKGMILQNDSECLIFGTIARQNNNSYLVQKVFFGGMNHQQTPFYLFAEHSKIIDKSIILYKATLFVKSNNTLIPSNSLPKNYMLPLSFEINPLFDSWNATNLKDIKLLPIITHNAYSRSFVLPIILAISQYILGFITLLIIASIGMGLRNSLSFKGADSIGSFVVLICSYPFTLLIYYYLSLLIQVVVHYLIKI